ncbi:MAG: Uma2 family endonuclease [Acidothermaceae bacterium]
MVVMTGNATNTVGLPFGRPLTIDDVEQLPDDGHRYELLDGTLLVSPAPGWSHQRVVFNLAKALDDACPAAMQMVTAPFAVTFGTNDTEFQPDVLIARYDDLTAKNLPAAPALAVEVRSPSTSLVDLNLKKAAYERFGVESYWVVDPDEPSIIVFELDEGSYREATRGNGADVMQVTKPFPVRLCPVELRRGLDPQ